MRQQGGAASEGVWSAALDVRLRLVSCRCAGCGWASGPLPAPAAVREAAVAHLAEHVLRERLPNHLRTCGCRTAGCGWHPGRRGCGGQLVLILFRGPDGLSWHLAEACERCADAIPQAARIPQGADPARRRRGGEAPTLAAQHLAARAALARVASLPEHVGAEARLLAAVCALRTRRTGISPLPHGLIRALGITQPGRAIGELEDTGWLHYLSRPRGGPAVFIPDLVGNRSSRAGQWALRLLADPRVAGLGTAARLTVLTVLAWAEQPGQAFLVEPDAAARTTGLRPRAFDAAVARARATGALGPCTAMPSGLLRCEQPCIVNPLAK
ncbi:hypothetical protein ACFV4P_33965 [Kitasatospora sp. NPDC059795]|uniref:hypothetical protein n=1 Tax=Kitasatospora sp. NPDC059795 TaxID=3346949 RepID=UPI00364BE7DB